MLSIAAREWMAEGAAKGRIEGRAQGKADTLLRLLRKRFRTVPDDLEQRIRTADSDHLDDWAERILDARTLAEVFGTDQPH